MPRNRTTRRTFLETSGALALGALLAGCTGGGGAEAASSEDDGAGGSGGGAGGSDGGSSKSGSSGGSNGASNAATFGGWFEGVSNYDGVVDKTGQSEVTVKVGVDGNSGSNGFGPAAIKVDTGTTVVWEWTGKGSSHNVVAADGTFESEYHSEAGATFEHPFSAAGTQKYFCQPHKAMGMKGVVVVE